MLDTSRFCLLPGNQRILCHICSRRNYGYTQSIYSEAVADTLAAPQGQRLIVEEVECRLSIVDKLEATVEANLKQAGGLRQSILKQAFSGRLVPQDPDDEPASVFLEWSRAERDAAKPKSRKERRSKARPQKSAYAEQRGLF